jgi:hypothetical protein
MARRALGCRELLPPNALCIKHSPSTHQADDHTSACKRWRLATPAFLLLFPATANAPGSLRLVQVVSIQLSERWMGEMRNSSIWPLKGSTMALTRAQACLNPGVLSRDLDRALDRLNQVGVHAVGPITRQLAETKGHSTLPHQEGDHARAGRGGR